MQTTPYKRRLIITLVVMGLFAVPVVVGGQLAMQHIRTSPIKWVPATFEKRREYDEFEERFETNDVVIISWKDCTPDDPRLEKVRKALAEPDDSEAGAKIKRYVRRSFSGPSLSEEMVIERGNIRLREEDIHERLAGSLFSHDDDTTCCVALLTPEGVDNRKEAVPAVIEVASAESGVPIEQLHFVGPIVDGYTIDVNSVDSMRTFVIPSAIIVLIMCRICLRSWPFTFLVFFIAIFGEMLTLALVYYSGETMNAVLIVMPPLVMVLTVSAAVHLVNYYHDEVRRCGTSDAPRKALRNGLLPCLLATGTTAIGLLSLMLSDVIPVKLFGIYSTAGIVTTLVLLFLTLPGAQEMWPVVPRQQRLDNKEPTWADLSAIANFCCRYPLAIVIIGLSLMMACGWGLQWMRTSVNVRSLFTPDSKILADYNWFEEKVGPMVPVEVVMHFPPDFERNAVHQVDLVKEIQYQMNQIDGVDGTISAGTFCPVIPRDAVGRAGVNSILENKLSEFDRINYFKQGEGDKSWRISGRVAAVRRQEGESDVDYGDFLDKIQHEIDPRLWAIHYYHQISEEFVDLNWRERGDLKVLLVGGEAKDVLALWQPTDEDSDDGQSEPQRLTDNSEIFVDELIYLLQRLDGFDEYNMTAVGAAELPDDYSGYDAVIVVAGADAQAEKLKSNDIPVFDARVHSLAALGEAEDPREITATYTGVMPLAYEVQRVLLQDLIKSFLSAVALVSVVMIVLQRSAVAGLISMIPNVFPMIVLFGITSWRDMPIDIGTVMTASVALGIAVDDTLHFLTWYNREHSETGDNVAAVKLAFRHCAKAMLQTTLICSLGLVIYTLSWFMPTRRFSWMMVTLLMAAVVGDLVLLPALLASPIGKLFPKRKLIGDPLASEDKADDRPDGTLKSDATAPA